jgi:hypothetical protein
MTESIGLTSMDGCISGEFKLIDSEPRDINETNFARPMDWMEKEGDSSTILKDL